MTKILQEMMIKPFELECNDEMYFRGEKYYVHREEQVVEIYRYGNINTLTYFNGFSIEKFRKYTKINSLFLKVKFKGSGTFKLKNKWLTAGDYLEECIFEKKYNCVNSNIIEINLSDALDRKGIIYFELYAHEECILYNFTYEQLEDYSPCNIAISICTYKREKYICKLLQLYYKYKNHNLLKVFISDNGKSLDIVQSNDVYIFPNKNAGGAAGFARCMLEVDNYNRNHSRKLDYIVLMDDDIFIDFNIFDRLIAFISLLKDDYLTYFIAGSMLSLDYPYIQYEKYSSWRGDSFVQFGENSNFLDINTVIRNEREEFFNHQLIGWWFSCFSTKIINDNNYPFPCFFRGDDMEFSIRNGSNLLTLNGVCVWHEPFYKKYSIVSENYYLIRNTLVINALYVHNMNAISNVKYILKKIIVNLIKYDYTAADLILQAVGDYMRGTDFFKYTDAEDLNASLANKNHHTLSLDELKIEYKFSDIESQIYNETDKNSFQRVFRKFTGNGLLIPKIFYRSFGFSLLGLGARNINFYRKKKVLNFDPFTKRGYFTEVKKTRAIAILIHYIGISIKFLARNHEIRKDYQMNMRELYTRDFWLQYLDLHTK